MTYGYVNMRLTRSGGPLRAAGPGGGQSAKSTRALKACWSEWMVNPP